MAKKALFTSLVLSGLVILLGTGVCFADALAQLEKVETYKWYPAQAEAIYQEITRDYPDSSYALTAHKNLVISYLSAKRDNDAQESFNELVADFSGNSSLPAALYDIARIYERTREYEKAGGLYQQIIQQYSDSSSAGKVQIAGSRINILSYIESRDDDGAQAATNSLIASFSGHSELPVSLYDIARRYERAKKYDKAKGLYQQIIQQYSGSSAAGRAELAIERTGIFSLIESGKTAGAEINGLASGFSGHSDLSEALYHIGIRYEGVKAYEQAKGVYQQIISQYADSSHAARALLLVPKIDILLQIESGNYTVAQAGVDSLISEFTGHSYLPAVLGEIARSYERAGEYQRSNNVYQQIVDGYGESSYANGAQIGMARNQALIYVDAGNDAAVNIEVDKLISEYQSPWAVSRVAKQYQGREKYQKAIAIYDKVISGFGGSGAAAEACCLAGECCRQLADYEKSIQYYQKVVDEYGGYRLAWNAQFMTGRNYEKLKETGAVSASEANVKIKAAYEQLLAKYPDCKAAKAARQWLRR